MPKKGYKHTEETKRKISKSINKPKTIKSIKEKLIGIPKSKEHRQKIGKSNKGISRNKGIPKSKETKRKMSENRKGKTGIKANSWKDGKAWFIKKLRRYVRIRDNNICQNPYCKNGQPQIKNGNLDTHHIEKDNNNFWKIITLCCYCHAKTEKNNIEHWNNIFLKILKEKRVGIIQCINKNNQYPPELKEMMNDNEFLEYYKNVGEIGIVGY